MHEPTPQAPAAAALPELLDKAADTHSRVAVQLGHLRATLAAGLDVLQQDHPPGTPLRGHLLIEVAESLAEQVADMARCLGSELAEARRVAGPALQLAPRAADAVHETGPSVGDCAAPLLQASAPDMEPLHRQALAVLLLELAGHADSATCALDAAIGAGDLRLVETAGTTVRHLGALADRMAEALGEAPIREPDEWRLSLQAAEAVAVLSDEAAPLGLAAEVA